MPPINSVNPASLSDLDLALAAATAAGDTALLYFGKQVDVEVKSSPADLVSRADRAAEDAAVAELRRHRPDDGYVGEEGSSRVAADGRRWVVDGIDGTYNFLHGVPYWCAAVCLLDEHGPAVSAIWDPVARHATVAGRGHGAVSGESPLLLVRGQALAQLGLATYLHPQSMDDPAVAVPLARAMRACATVRVTGSGSLDLVRVAQGKIGVVAARCLGLGLVPRGADRRGGWRIARTDLGRRARVVRGRPARSGA